MCNTGVHQACIHMTDDEFVTLKNNGEEWFCARCREIKSSKIKWGDLRGEEEIGKVIRSAYKTIIGWNKNIFPIPRGKCGNDFIKELTSLINLFVNKGPTRQIGKG